MRASQKTRPPRLDVQRLRVSFARGEPLKYLTHLDMMRLWERVLRRAQIPLSYSEGYSHHPKLALASPLPVGVTSQVELLDIFLWRRLSPYALIKAVTDQLSPGLEVLEVEQVSLRVPSLQSQLRYTEYQVAVLQDGRNHQEVERAIVDLLAQEHLSWQRHRDTGDRPLDLRTTVDRIWVIGAQAGCWLLGMRLRSDPTITGRPEEVTAALGFGEPPISRHRTKLVLEAPRLPSRRFG